MQQNVGGRIIRVGQLQRRGRLLYEVRVRMSSRDHATASRSLQATPAATPAAVIAAARSGSGWLLALLNAHPDVHFQGELFNLEQAPLAAVEDPRRYLAERLAAADATRVTGFKLLYHQARLAYLRDFLREMDRGRRARVDWRQVFPMRPVRRSDAPKLINAWHAVRATSACRVVHLQRRNLLRQHLSHARLMAVSHARWRQTLATDAAPVVLDAAHLVTRFQRHLRRAAQVDAFFRAWPRLTVWYEDLVADCATETQRLFAFLGVDTPSTWGPRATRDHTPLRDAIGNYEAVERALIGTPWAAFLDDDQP
ncbi:MAG: sulfotransferase [bacterium]